MWPPTTRDQKAMQLHRNCFAAHPGARATRALGIGLLACKAGAPAPGLRPSCAHTWRRLDRPCARATPAARLRHRTSGDPTPDRRPIVARSASAASGLRAPHRSEPSDDLGRRNAPIGVPRCLPPIASRPRKSAPRPRSRSTVEMEPAFVGNLASGSPPGLRRQPSTGGCALARSPLVAHLPTLVGPRLAP